MATEIKLTVNTEEAAELVGVSTRSIQRLVANGEFPKPVKLGTRVLWRRADVELFIAAGSMSAYRRARRGK